MKKLLVVSAIVAVGAFAAVALAYDGGPGVDAEPQVVAGNPRCLAGSTAYQLKVDPGANGTFAIDGPNGVAYITIANYNGQTFDWYIGMDADNDQLDEDAASYDRIDADKVIVKGGPNALIYDYGSGDDGTDDDFGTGLHAPVNPNGNTSATRYYGISHIQFCFDPKA